MQRRTTCWMVTVTLPWMITSARAEPCELVPIEPRGARQTYVNDMNNWGQVVGSFEQPEGGADAFLWQRGEVTILQAQASAEAVNDFGRIVGYVMDVATPVPVTWTRAGMFRLPPPPNPSVSSAMDVNNRGQIIGGDIFRRCLFWQDAHSAPIVIGSLGGGSCQPVAINDRGEVVGVSVNEAGEYHGFVWREGSFVDIGLPEHPDEGVTITSTALTAINDHGLAVGTATDAEGGVYALSWTRQRGARVEAIEASPTSVNAWGAIAASSEPRWPAPNLLLGNPFGRFRDKGALGGALRGALVLNDYFQLAWSATGDDGLAHAYTCALH